MSKLVFEPSQPTSLDRDDFLFVYGGVYEKTPWIAEAVFDEGLTPACDTLDGLVSAFAKRVEEGGEERQLALLRAHPDLAGKLAAAGELTADSTLEQAGAGLDQCTSAELAAFQDLNARYTEKFGFPFIIAVSGFQREQILEVFKTRLNNSKHDEFETALAEVHKIARIRLMALANPE